MFIFIFIHLEKKSFNIIIILKIVCYIVYLEGFIVKLALEFLVVSHFANSFHKIFLNYVFSFSAVNLIWI